MSGARLVHPILAALLLAACAQAPEAGAVRTVGDGAIEFDATVDPEAFGGEGETAGYHLIVWEGGRAADHALFRAAVSDVQIVDALEALGAEPGNALRLDTWDLRNDADAEDPERVIAGPPVRIEVRVPGRDAPLALDDFLEDPGGRGFTMRFGGHRENIPAWHSGCVVCLYSCPGSKVGNAAYTVADFVRGATRFAVRPGTLPREGTPVTIRLVLERDPA